LKALADKKPHDLHEEATYLCETVKPQMLAVRAMVDKAEGLLEAGLYPFPTYEQLIYSHHS
jgi:glutamine synthetase type III